MLDYRDPYAPQSEAGEEPFRRTDGEITESNLGLDEERAESNSLGSVLYEILETVLLAVVIWLVVNFATARYVVEGQSMESNLHTGQFLIVSRLHYMQIGESISLGDPQRGDIVVFDFPGNPSDDYVKRVIGLPGETVTIDEAGQVFINGQPIEEPYLAPEQTQPYRGRVGTWTVPMDSYFVLGDNRNSSDDSRRWNELEETYIVGKAWLSYWPPQHWGVIPHYDYATAQE